MHHFSRIVSIIACAILLLAACAPAAVPAVPTATPMPPTATATLLPPTPTTALTPTVTPTPVDLGNFEDPTTWPTNYEGMNLQNYWNKTDFTTNGRPDQEKAKQEDQIFDDFCNASMKKILTDSGVDTGKLTDDQIFEKYLEWGQQNPDNPVIISFQKVRNILKDPNNYVIAYSDNGQKYMGIQNDSRFTKNQLTDFLATHNSTVNLNIFGIQTEIKAQDDSSADGKLMAVFRLPGLNPETQAVGILVSYPNYNITNSDGTHPTAYYPLLVNFGNVSIKSGDTYLARYDPDNLPSSHQAGERFLAQYTKEEIYRKTYNGVSMSAFPTTLADILKMTNQEIITTQNGSPNPAIQPGDVIDATFYPRNLGLQAVSSIQTVSTP